MIINKRLSNRNVLEMYASKDFSQELKVNKFVFLAVVRGRQDIIVGDRKISVFPDNFIIIAPGSKFRPVTAPGYLTRTIQLTLSNEFISELHTESDLPIAYLPDRIMLGGTDHTLLNVAHELKGDLRYTLSHLSAYLQQGAEEERLLNSYLQHLIFSYYQVCGSNFSKAMLRLNCSREETGKEILRRLLLAREYISTHYNLQFGLDQVAAASLMSPTHLRRNFKLAYGISVFQYLAQLRLSRAKYFLKATTFPVSQISIMVGCDSVSTFVQSFKSAFGITPARFRSRECFA